MSPSELKRHVDAIGSHYFSRDTMKLFGDTLGNYKVEFVVIATRENPECAVWQLSRKAPVKHGLQSTHYFDAGTFESRYPA